MKRYMFAAVTLAVALGAGSAQAAEPPTWSPQHPSWNTPTEAAVRLCRDYVRRIEPLSTRFDAYTEGPPNYQIHFFGSAHERFQFEKCLVGQGVTFADDRARRQ